jgi:hypothetical protein
MVSDNCSVYCTCKPHHDDIRGRLSPGISDCNENFLFTNPHQCFVFTRSLHPHSIEPSNDLDVEVLRSLEDGLLDFAGCAIVVSHDRYFLNRVATHILACEGDSKWFFFPGNYAEYEANRVERLGETSIKRITYAPLINA